MSRERARRRAEREAAAEVERERRARALRRRERRTAAVRGATRPLRPVTAALRAATGLVDGRSGRTALGRARGRENGLLLAVVLPLHVILWLVTTSWWLRGSALVLTALAWPLLTVIFFDRRPTR
jgi:hypothetical protein